jgi:hypothetical protein
LIVAIAGAHHHHGLAADRHRVVVAGVRDLRLVAAIDPDLLEDAFHLLVEDLLIGVDAFVDPVGFHESLDVHRRVFLRMRRTPCSVHKLVELSNKPS